MSYPFEMDYWGSLMNIDENFEGSGASFSAKENPQRKLWVFCFPKNTQVFSA